MPISGAERGKIMSHIPLITILKTTVSKNNVSQSEIYREKQRERNYLL